MPHITPAFNPSPAVFKLQKKRDKVILDLKRSYRKSRKVLQILHRCKTSRVTRSELDFDIRFALIGCQLKQQQVNLARKVILLTRDLRRMQVIVQSF